MHLPGNPKNAQAFIDSWQTAVSDSLATFAKLAVSAENTASTLSVIATAVLWPIRQSVAGKEGNALFAVESITEDEGEIVSLVQAWPDDRIAAARQLSKRLEVDEALRLKLTRLVNHFNAQAQFAGHFANVIAAPQGQGNIYNVSEQINAAMVNIGGTLTIKELVLQVSQQVEIPPPPAPRKPPQIPDFVGRRVEKHAYLENLENDGLVVITGMPGAGKTALAAEIARAAALPEKVFWHSFHAGDSVQSVLWQLAAFLAWHGQTQVWELLQGAKQSGGQPPPPETVVEYILSYLEGSQFLLCLDDFQYVDDDPLLMQIIARIQDLLGTSVRMIITSRRLPKFVQASQFKPLAGMEADDSRQLLQRQGLNLSEQQFATLHDSVEGNVELLILSAQALRFSNAPDNFIENLARADSVENYLINEVDESLTGNERETMQAVAVLLGHPGSRELIETLLHGRNAWRDLRSLSQRYLLTVWEGEAGRSYSQHSIVQAFYYAQLSSRERKQKHQITGEYYERKEVDYLLAGLHLQRADAYQEAANLLTDNLWPIINEGQVTALRQLLETFQPSQIEDLEQVKIKLGLGDIYAFIGERQQSENAYQDVIALTKDHINTETGKRQVAKAYQGLSALREYGNPEDALVWSEKGLALFTEEENFPEKAALFISQGNASMNLENLESAKTALENGLGILSRTDPLRSISLRNLGAVHYYSGKREKAIAVTREALMLSQQRYDYIQTVSILSNLAIYEFEDGQWQQAVARWQEAYETASRLGNLHDKIGAGGNLGAAYINIGEFGLAEKYLLEALADAQSNEMRLFEIILKFRLGDLYTRKGDHESGITWLLEAEGQATEAQSEWDLPDIRRVLAEAKIANGEPEEAKRYIQQVVDQAQKLGDPMLIGMGLRVMGNVSAAQADTVQADEAYQSSLEILNGLNEFELARAKRDYGKFLIDGGHIENGRNQLESAQEIYQALGAKWNT